MLKKRKAIAINTHLHASELMKTHWLTDTSWVISLAAKEELEGTTRDRTWQQLNMTAIAPTHPTTNILNRLRTHALKQDAHVSHIGIKAPVLDGTIGCMRKSSCVSPVRSNSQEEVFTALEALLHRWHLGRWVGWWGRRHIWGCCWRCIAVMTERRYWSCCEVRFSCDCAVGPSKCKREGIRTREVAVVTPITKILVQSCVAEHVIEVVRGSNIPLGHILVEQSCSTEPDDRIEIKILPWHSLRTKTTYISKKLVEELVFHMLMGCGNENSVSLCCLDNHSIIVFSKCSMSLTLLNAGAL